MLNLSVYPPNRPGYRFAIHMKVTYINGLALQKEEFVILLKKNEIPHTRHVRGSNYCLMNVFPDRIPGRAIIVSVVSSYKKINSNYAFGLAVAKF